MFRPLDISDLSENQKLELLHNIVMERDEALETIKQRDKEINALKHMLDRKDDEKMKFVITNVLPILIENNDHTIRINLPTPKRAKLPKGWVIKGGRVEHE